ncbi:MAG: hypothetical protein K9M81_03400 [Chthoniobacterales bacterium]|nr:hypothetical protein [Chthoniobacterales bacterium]
MISEVSDVFLSETETRIVKILFLHLDCSEMIGLTRIFHTDHLRKPGSQMDAALISKSSSGSMYSYSRRQTSSLALPHQPSQPPRRDPYEICGLNNKTS